LESEAVCWAVYAISASIEDMRIDHGGADVPVSEEFLDCPDIIAVLKWMGGKRMPEGVTTGWFGDPSFPNSFLDRSLQDD
jgi:hypothetical protein